MKARVKLYTYDGSTQNRFPVKLILTHKGKTRRKILGHSHADDWDFLRDLPRPTHPDFETLYNEISRINILAARSVFLQMVDLDHAEKYFGREIARNAAQMDFYAFAESQIREMKNQGREGNAAAYQFTVDQLAKFAPELRFDQITRFFLENFKQHKRTQGLKNTSIRTYLYELRAIYNKAVRMGICEDRRPFAGIFLDLPVRKRRYKNQYLDREGILKLQSISGVSAAQQMAVDFSLLQFYLGGLDLVDLYHLKRSQIVNGRVYLMRTKLGQRADQFDIKLLEPARVLLEKYSAPGGVYLFPWAKDRTRYHSFRSNHNAKLKRIQKNAEIQIMPAGGILTSKVIRHTFATLGKFAHLEPDLIRELMGHERNEIDTIYKDRYPESVRDAALQTIVFGKNPT